MLSDFTWHLVAARTAEVLGCSSIAQGHRAAAQIVGFL